MANVLPPVRFHVDESIVRLPPASEIALYRIAQESLSNIAKHANAKAVDLWLERKGDQVTLRVTDDGAGFSQTQTATGGREHLGLFTIRERARLAGGTSKVMSIRGKGTTVVAQVPA